MMDEIAQLIDNDDPKPKLKFPDMPALSEKTISIKKIDSISIEDEEIQNLNIQE